MLRAIFIFGFFFLAHTSAFTQNKRVELEVKRQKLLQQIEQNKKLLQQTQVEKTGANLRAELLQNQIEDRQNLILNLGDDLVLTDSIISRTDTAIVALNDDLYKLKSEFGQMLRKAYRMHVPSNSLLFLFASKSFSESYKRWQYFRQYEKFRKRQADLIGQITGSLVHKNSLLIGQRQTKDSLKVGLETQKAILQIERGEKIKMAEALKSDEQKLKGDLKSAQKQNNKLNNAIEDLIGAEIEARKAEATAKRRRLKEESDRIAEIKQKKQTESTSNKKGKETVNKPTVAATEDVLTDSRETLELSADFRNNKGKLPPPVNGNIIRGFGKQQVLNKVVSVNNGIDIKTLPGAEVHSVAAGTVTVVSSIPGLGQIIILQHGNYYTVYAHLSAVSVSKGQAVAPRQTIGKSGVNLLTNDPELHFELWLERVHVDPSPWFVH